MALTVAGDRETQTWLTSVLRPAGSLDAAATRRLAEALATLASLSDMVVVDLTATRVPSPGRLARALRAPAAPSAIVAIDRAPATTAAATSTRRATSGCRRPARVLGSVTVAR